MKFSLNFCLKKVLVIVLFSSFLIGCKNEKKTTSEKIETEKEETLSKEPFFKLSLAQWSLNKAIRFDGMNPFDFAQKANEMGFAGLEYVSQLYSKKIEDLGMQVVLDSIKYQSDKHNIKNLIIMVDNEGELATADDAKRQEAIDKHKKWVDAAAFLGCHSIRVNLFGSTDPEIWKTYSVKGLGALSDYAATKNVNVIVENHGYLSSNGALLAAVMQQVNKPNCGTLPDFGNFCLKRKDGAQWDAPCVEEYDKYKGVEELMPYAKAVSAKSYDFGDDGHETTIDYKKMLQIVKKAGYTGFIGIEYEGGRLNEEQGILATKKLLLDLAKEI